MRDAIRLWWRHLRHRCAVCGDPLTTSSIYDLHSIGPYCRACNKLDRWAKALGMRPDRIHHTLAMNAAYRASKGVSHG